MKKIKIFHAMMLYDSLIQKVYSKNPSLKSTTYRTQLETMLQEGIGGQTVFWKDYLNNNDFELQVCITNAEFVQKKWAEENNIFVDSEKWRREILFSQIQVYCPDIIFAHDQWPFRSILNELKTKVPSIKLVIGWDGVLWHDLDMYKEYDVILTPVKETVEYYENNNMSAFQFNFGFQPAILNKIKIREPIYDCAFIGQVSPNGQHSERFLMLSELSKSVKLDIWTPSLGFNDWKRYCYHQMRRLLKFKLSEFKQVYQFWKMNHSDVYGLDMYQVIADSRIVVNNHINQAKIYAANMRLFEVTGAGACLVTDYKENLSDYFDINNEIVTYKTNAELLSKVKYLLSHDEERSKIAQAGQLRTLRDHNYQLRIDAFTSYLLKTYTSA